MPPARATDTQQVRDHLGDRLYRRAADLVPISFEEYADAVARLQDAYAARVPSPPDSDSEAQDSGDRRGYSRGWSHRVSRTAGETPNWRCAILHVPDLPSRRQKNDQPFRLIALASSSSFFLFIAVFLPSYLAQFGPAWPGSTRLGSA